MPSNDNNKVEYGVSQLHIASYTVSGGTVTIGTPVALPGAVSITLEPEGDENKFYADNVVYYGGYTDNGFSGSVEVARVPDAIKTQFFGYVQLADGGIGQVKGASKPNVCILFEADGDALHRRAIAYNVSLGGINREYNTTEDTIEPTTETFDISVLGDNGTGLTLVTYNAGDAGYATLFTTPPAPTL